MDRSLDINKAEAATIQAIFDLYRERRNIRLVKEEVDRRGLRTKRRPNEGGVLSGGRIFSRGHIHLILTNPVYAGRIRHKTIVHDGAHEAIIDPTEWEAVQRMRRGHGAGLQAPKGLLSRENSMMKPGIA